MTGIAKKRAHNPHTFRKIYSPIEPRPKQLAWIMVWFSLIKSNQIRVQVSCQRLLSRHLAFQKTKASSARRTEILSLPTHQKTNTWNHLDIHHSFEYSRGFYESLQKYTIVSFQWYCIHVVPPHPHNVSVW